MMQIKIINHYYSVSSIHRYNEDFDTPISIMLDYYKSIHIGIMGRVASKVFIGSNGSMEIRIMHNLYQQVYKYSIPKNYIPLSIEFISLMGMISIEAYWKTKRKTYYTFIPLQGRFYQTEL